ncbi:hypothetical protein OPT61_g204 [Boeremia exigua]|uniref:Uncharacterized protein n=1 Tax=Boeremia exigua TaxID=749465 RepID=A0ACC2IUP4_9PLEO|nr:hypothetical protein OPT61_g204 [Boeremia exigua]
MVEHQYDVRHTPAADGARCLEIRSLRSLMVDLRREQPFGLMPCVYWSAFACLHGKRADLSIKLRGETNMSRGTNKFVVEQSEVVETEACHYAPTWLVPTWPKYYMVVFLLKDCLLERAVAILRSQLDVQRSIMP